MEDRIELVNRLIREELVPAIHALRPKVKDVKFTTSKEAFVNSETPISIEDIVGKRGKK